MRKQIDKNIFINLLIKVIEFIVITIGSVLLGYFLIFNKFINNIDGHLYSLISLIPRISILDILIIPFNYNFLHLADSRPTYFYFMVLFFLIYMLIFKRKQFGWALFSILLGSILAYIVTAVDWQYVFRERPYLFWPNNVDSFGKQAWRSWSSYPSGHVRETTLYSTLIINFIPKLKWVGIAFIIFIGFSRVYLGAHYPFDVFAGIIIGFMIGKLSLNILKIIENKIFIKEGQM